MLRYLILTFLLIGLFRFIMRFVLPVLRIATAVRGQVTNMQGGPQQPPRQAPQNRNVRKGDYIDYEEVNE